MTAKMPKVLAVSSSGGHWVQLLRLRPAFSKCRMVYVTTNKDYQRQIVNSDHGENQPPIRFYTTVVATRWQKFKLLRQLAKLALITLWERPDVVITTGAAPGLFAIILGRLVGARTIWIDSIANTGELSMSGQKARKFANVTLTQWEHLAGSDDQDVEYWGRVI